MCSKHGTYRSNLAKLVAENSLEEVRTTTRDAFSSYAANNTTYAKSVTALRKLKGLGPATESLVLACYDLLTNCFAIRTGRIPNLVDGIERLTIQWKNSKTFLRKYKTFRSDWRRKADRWLRRLTLRNMHIRWLKECSSSIVAIQLEIATTMLYDPHLQSGGK